MSCTRRPIAATFAALLIVLVGGCSKQEGGPGGGDGGSGPPPTSCTSSQDCASSERCDLTIERCVPKCTADNHCPRNSGTRCDENTGECIPAKACTNDFNCPSTESGAYCTDDEPCVCVPDSSVAEKGGRQKGVCWRPAKTCEPCGASLECGEGEFFEERPGACRVYTVGGEDQAVCLPKVTNRCPAGMVQANTSTHAGLDGLCVPQSGDCASMAPCLDDGDCKEPGFPTCDPVSQICIPGCSFDFLLKETIGCTPGYVCNATPKGSDPALLDRCETALGFGIGSCAPPCGADADCKSIDPSYVCRDDGDGGRCRPDGCVSDRECAGNAPHQGYCDVSSGSCVSSACRTGVDHRNGCGTDIGFADCALGFKCVEGDSPGVGSCEEMNCIERGGAEVACFMGFYCSGEPYRDMFTGLPTGQVVELPGVPVGECGPMDLEVWCSEDTCATDASCADRPAPTNHPDSPPVCTTFGMDYPSCFWGCESEAECPALWSCSSVGQEFECGGTSPAEFCQTDDDCTGGSRCIEPIVMGSPASFSGEEPFKVCECTATEACGEGFSCNAGIATAGAVPGDPTYEKVQARYCTADRACGASGSCEWFGMFNPYLEMPRFICANTPPSMEGPAVSCPTPDEIEGGLKVRPGKSVSDQRYCVRTSICQPTYRRDPNTGDPECTYYGAE